MLKRNYIQNIIIFSSMLKRNNVQLWEVTEGQLAQTPKTLVKREEFFSRACQVIWNLQGKFSYCVFLLYGKDKLLFAKYTS